MCTQSQNTALKTMFLLVILTPVLMCVLYPHHQVTLQHQRGDLQFNSILTLSTGRQHQIPRVMGSVPQDCPHPEDANGKSRLSPVPLTYQLQMATDLRFSRHPTLAH